MLRFLLICVWVLAGATGAMAAGREAGCSSLLSCLFGSGRPAAASRERKVVAYRDAAKYPAGSIVVSTPERRLYLVLGSGKAMSYPVGVGREGYAWSGTSKVVRKA